MNSFRSFLIKAETAALVLLFAMTNLKAQDPTYLCELRNDVQVDASTFEFDVYLLRTGTTAFEYSSMQFGININPGVRNNGTITVTLVPGTSELNAAQIPASNKFSFNNTVNCIIMTGTAPPGAGNGTIISNIGNGTRVGRIRLSNSVNFGSVRPDLTWSFSLATGYITKVNAYVGGLSKEITIQSSQTNSNLANNLLNPPAPLQYSVTGGGSFCEGDAGVAVGLSDSEAGVTYTLIRGTTDLTPTVAGTGNPISFGNQTVAGTYTVEGTNAGGTTTMTGSAVVTVNPLPVPAGTITGTASVCQGATAVAYSVPDIANASSYEWTYTGSGATINGTTRNITINFASNATSGNLTVRGLNSCGYGTVSPTFAITVSSVPAAAGTITGTASVCRGTNSVAYSVPVIPNSVSYSWAYTGTGATITGTSNSVTINFNSSATSGNLTVRGVNTCGNGAVSPTYAIAVNDLPTVNAGTDQTIPNGTSTTLTGTVTGTGPFTYSWTPAGQVTSPASLTTNTSILSSTTIFTLTAISTSTTCSNNDQVTVNVTGGALSAAASATPGTVCSGTSVQLAANASGGSGSYTYAWTSSPAGFTSGSANPTVTPSSNITYYVAVNDGFSTVNSQAAVTVNAIPSAPTVSLIQPDCGTATGTITVTAPTGAGMTYSINGSTYTNTTGVFTGVASGPYTVTARSSAGCTSLGTAATINDQPPTPVVGNQTTTVGTGTPFTVTPTGTPTGTTYTWTVPTYTGGVTGGAAQTTGVASITGTLSVPSGTGTAIYTVTPRTGTCNGSTFTLTVTVTSTCVPVVITADPVNASICSGGSATFSVTATGTTPVYQWQYNDGGTWINVTNGTPGGAVYTNATTTTLGVSGISAAGSYQYRNNATNCSVSSDQSTAATLTVNANPAQPTITADGPTTFCAGEDVILTSSVASTYLWSTGATTRNITVSTAGNYTVQVTNASSCQSVVSATTVVTVNALPSRPTISPAGSVTICAGSSQTLTSSAGVSYLWSNGETTQSIAVNSTGTYTVQVTNTFGCLSTASLATSVTVNPTPATPTITASGLTTFCAGGSVTLTSSVSSGYLWSTGATTRAIIVNATGTYWVRVTDANGCQSAQSATTAVTVNTLPTAPTVGTITQPTCTVSTGSVVLGGLPAGSWTVNPGNITGSTPTVTVTGLVAGSHTFTVTNSTGCTSAASVPVVINIQPAVPTVPVVGTVTQPTCAVSTGSVGFSGLPSTGIWTLTRLPDGDISTGTGVTATLPGIPSGTYTFTVTNIAGCVSTATAPVIINAPLPVPAVPVQTVDCSGGFNHALVTVTSPTGAGYQYQLDAGAFQTGATFTDVANGNHTITVRNASGCTATGTTFSINCGCTNPPLVTLAASSGSTCGVAAVTVSGNTFGGSATSVVLSDNGGGTVTPASSSASPFSFTYTPTAADAGRTVVITVTTNNPLGSPCAAASATYTLAVNANPAAPVPGTVTQPSCANPDGSVMLNNLPAMGDWTITRTPGGTNTTGSGTSTTVSGLTPGTFTFTVTNALGCISPASANVVISAQPDTPSAPVIGTITQPTCALSTGTVAISGLPATGTWTLTRSPGGVAVSGTGTTRTVTGVTSGTYTFTVANAAGCISPASGEVVIITQPETPFAPVIGTITHPTCGLATGSILLENMPANGEWTLTRYPGGITSTGTGTSTTISTLGAGTYNFAVTSASGCNSPVSANAVINNQPPTPTAPVIGTITHPTFTVATGSVVLSGLPSSGTWTLTRNPDGFTSQGTGTTRTVSGLEPGTYSFTVTNSVGCTSVLTGDIIINARPGAPIVVINNPPNICSDQTTDLTQPAVTAGSDANLTFTYWTDAAATVTLATPATTPAGTYYIQGTSTAGFSTIKPVVVTADELPVANAGIDRILDYAFGTTLDAEIPEIGTGIWELVSGTGDIFNSTAPSTAVSGLSIGDNVFSWTVTNGACDPVSDSVLIKVNSLLIPTLITPNQDGANDYFVLRGLESLGQTELTVFDRRGLKVYENRDYDNSWDGIDYNSNPLPDDTYFWVVRADNGVSLSGYIVVRR